MTTGNYQLDMSKGSILKSTVRFAVPLIFASILQLLYNAADLIIVSRHAGSNAMASVGATSSVTHLLVNIFIGVSLGASVVVSRKFGANDEEGIKKAVRTAMLLSIIVGIFAGVSGFLYSKPVLTLMGTPEGEVLDGAVLYMKIIFIGVPASLVYNFGASVLRAIGDTKRPLYILSLTGIINVLLNLILVIGFNLSVAGVAIATAVSNYISAIIILYILTHSDGCVRLNLRKLKLYKKELFEILKIGVPAGIQSSFFSLSNSVLQSSVNSYGEAAIAGNAASSNIEAFVYTAMNAFYQATLTGVSQNYGAKKEKRIIKTVLTSTLCVTLVGIVLGGLCVIFSKQLLGIYITDSAEALNYGARRILLSCLPYFLCGIMEVLTGALRGLGCSVITAVSAFVGTCGFRIFWVTVILKAIGGGIDILYLCWPISWFIVIVLHLITLAIVKPRAIKKMYLN